jgi:LysM repeat protein
MCSIEQAFDSGGRSGKGRFEKLSVDLGTPSDMDTAAASFPRRSEMSTLAATPGFAAPRRRPAAAPRRLTAVPSVPATPAAPAVRLTRRGRLVLTLLFLGALMVVLTVFGASSAATGEAGRPVPTRTVVVDEGDTLWGIAADVAGPGEVREMVHRIQELNALSGSGVAIGQELAVPVG